MGMIKRRLGTDTLKFPGTDFDFVNTNIIVKIGNCVFRHLILAFALSIM